LANIRLGGWQIHSFS